MDDRRNNEAFARQSSASRLRGGHHRLETVPDPDANPNPNPNPDPEPYENMNRPTHHRQQQRRSASPSPSPNPNPNRLVDVSRDYGWPLDRGRTGRIRSRSPPPMVTRDARKRSHFDDGVGMSPRHYSPAPSTELRQRRELVAEPTSLNFNNDNADLQTRRVYGYEPSDPSRISKDNFNSISLSAADKHRFLGQKTVIVEDGVMARGRSYRSSPNVGPTPFYGDNTNGHLPSFSRTMETQHFEHGRPQFQDTDTIALNRLPLNQSYKDGVKPMFHVRDASYHMMSGSSSKGIASSSETSRARSEFLAYQDGLHLPHMNEFKSSAKHTEPIVLNAYGERPVIDSARNPEVGERNLIFYPRVSSPITCDHEDYFIPKSREVVDDRGYPAHDLHKMMAPRAQLDYGHTQNIYDYRDMSRPSISHPVADRNDNIDGSCGNMRRGITRYHPSLERQADTDYLDVRRTSHISKQGGEYLGSGFTNVEFGRTVSQDHEILHMGASKHHQISDLEADYGFGNDASPQFQEERLLRSPVSKYEIEMHRHNARMPNVRDEHGIYKSQNRLVKGRYGIQEDVSAYGSRTTSSGKLYSARQFQDLHETGEEWTNEEMSGLQTSRTTRFEHAGFRRAERKYDGLDNHHENFEPDEWFSSQDLPHTRKHSVGYYKNYGRQHIKGRRRPGYSSHYNSHQYDRKNQFYNRPNKFLKRNDGYYEDLHADDDNNDSNPTEDWVIHEESEPTEDSEEFKQLVHEAFLKYSKKLNVNAAVQRRYKEEGKAGSLFCIVCGRSVSKEFMDTQRLVTHAFMSHKVGLRAEHLALHKAICVLLGWSTVVPDETITWVPQILPKAEALAQKEDLIIWPPVIVVHNISLSDNNPEKWKVVSREALEAFIRGKGLIRGRIKVCLGKPADQSTMVVKFLGTFTGLGDAEKLHKYFAEHKRGRVELELAMSNNGSASCGEIGNNREAAGNIEEQILYGYLGISEDLDEVDFSTRNTCLIKSKMDIQDLANAPVKPEETN